MTFPADTCLALKSTGRRSRRKPELSPPGAPEGLGLSSPCGGFHGGKQPPCGHWHSCSVAATHRGRKRSGRGRCVSGEMKPAACSGEMKRTETAGTRQFTPLRRVPGRWAVRATQGRDAHRARPVPAWPRLAGSCLSVGDARSSGGSVTGAMARGGASASPPGGPRFTLPFVNVSMAAP